MSKHRRIVFVFDEDDAESPEDYEHSLNEAAEDANISIFSFIAGYEGYRVEEGN